MKKVICIAISMLCILSLLCACGTPIPSDDAKETTEEFLNCLAEKKYANAAELMHPDCTMDEKSLQELTEKIESDTFLDFSSGVELKQYTSFSSYITTGASTYTLAGYITVSDTDLPFTVVLKQNGENFGIESFSFSLSYTLVE